jgi:hypothetical protein
MQTTHLPKQLPFLPGNSYADPTITRYHKTQLLGFRDGTMLGKLIQKGEAMDLIKWKFREDCQSPGEHRPRTVEIHARWRPNEAHRNSHS